MGSVYDLLRGHVERAHARSRRVYSLPAQAWRRRTLSNVFELKDSLDTVLALDVDDAEVSRDR